MVDACNEKAVGIQPDSMTYKQTSVQHALDNKKSKEPLEASVDEIEECLRDNSKGILGLKGTLPYHVAVRLREEFFISKYDTKE